MWDTLELPSYQQQPKKIYHRDDDGNPIPPKTLSSLEPEPEPEPEEEQILAPQTSVIVSGLVSASQHNGKNALVLRYEPKKGRYAVELETGERKSLTTNISAFAAANRRGLGMSERAQLCPGLLVRSSCLLEDVTHADEPVDKVPLPGAGAPAPAPAEAADVPPPVRHLPFSCANSSFSLLLERLSVGLRVSRT